MGTDVAALADFPRRVRAASWFSMVGSPLSDAERADVDAYVAPLGLSPLDIAEVSTWQDAEACIKQTDWDERWWHAEDERRKSLLARAEDALGELELTRALTDLSDKVSDVVHGAAAVAASRGGVADQGLTRSAAGAATMAAYQAAVEATANVANGHPFAAKFRLFEAGHWPLCVRNGTFYVF
jgi:hypothetical protein